MDRQEEPVPDVVLEELFRKGFLLQKKDLLSLRARPVQPPPETLCQRDGTSILRTGRTQQRRALLLLPAFLQITVNKGEGGKTEDGNASLGWITGPDSQEPVLNIPRKDGGIIRLTGYRLRPRNVFVTVKTMSSVQKGKFLRVDDVIEEVIVFDGRDMVSSHGENSIEITPSLTPCYGVECSTLGFCTNRADDPSSVAWNEVETQSKMPDENAKDEIASIQSEIQVYNPVRPGLLPVGGFTGHLSKVERSGLNVSEEKMCSMVEKLLFGHRKSDVRDGHTGHAENRQF
jgi:hypothetical protein